MRYLIRKILLEEMTDRLYPGDYINRHIVNITPDEDDLPHYFMNKIISPRTFKLEKIYLSDLLDSDTSFKEYFESGEERYDEDEVNYDDLNHELVIVDGELLDGYSRASTLLRNGVKETWSFVAI
jgi:hypothetical protein